VNRHWKIHKIVLLYILMIGISFAGFNKNIDVSSYVDDNLYRSPDPVSEILTNVGIQLAYRSETSNLNYHYNGNLLFFKNYSLRNFTTHEIGLNYYKSFGKELNHYLYFGIDGNLRKNNEEYNYYDYNQIYAYTNLRFDFDWFFLRSGYNIRYRDYLNFDDLTNYRHYFFLQVNKSFATRTTLIMEADFGYKSFAGQKTFTTTIDTNGGGKGYGRGSGTYSGSISTINTLEVPSLTHSIVLVRLTQSLHEKVGIYIQYRQQFSLNDQSSLNNSENYFQDEELFDDPFSYESKSQSSRLTWLIWQSMKIQVGGSNISKNYISDQAYNSSSDTLGLGGPRIDERSNFYLILSKTFYLKNYWLKSFHLSFNYNYIKNESNSFWYNYRNAVLGGRIEWKF